MIYGQLQYYNYELEAWSRIAGVHKSELQKLLVQLNVLLSVSLVSSTDAKAANALIDHEEQVDHVRNHFE